MNWSRPIRQTHRWLSITFTVLVLVNIILNIASIPEQLALWAGIITLFPLVLLMITGLYLFVLPYTTPRRARDRTVE